MKVRSGVTAMQWGGTNVNELLSFATSCGIWGDDFKIDTERKVVIALDCEGEYDEYPVGTWFIGRAKSNIPMILPMSGFVFTELFGEEKAA